MIIINQKQKIKLKEIEIHLGNLANILSKKKRSNRTMIIIEQEKNNNNISFFSEHTIRHKT